MALTLLNIRQNKERKLDISIGPTNPDYSKKTRI